MTSPAAPPKPKSLMERINELADDGYGVDDIVYKLGKQRIYVQRAIVRHFVIGPEGKK
jgi:hypothetical protein